MCVYKETITHPHIQYIVFIILTPLNEYHSDDDIFQLNSYNVFCLFFLLPESSFFVSASSRTPSVTFGDSFDLQCIVKSRHSPGIPASVTWRFQPSEGASELRDVVTFTRDGTLQWGEQTLGLGTRTSVDRTRNNTNFRLSVTRAGRKESGTYQCAAILYRRNYDGTWKIIANRTSNLLGINVLQPGLLLSDGSAARRRG